MFPSHNPPTTDRQHHRVLVVDDEPTLRLGFAYALKSEDVCTETACNGSEALEKISAETYDAVLLDLRMPDIDGLEVITQLRNRGDEVPVILCSAFVTLESAFGAMRNGVMDFLIKPVRPVELRRAIAAILCPADDPMSKALCAAREGHFDQAVEIINAEEPRSDRDLLWSKVLKILADPHGTEVQLDQVLPQNTLELIAFQIPAA